MLVGMLVLGTPLLTNAQEEGGVGCPILVTVPWTYEEEVKVDLSESVKFEDSSNPLALSTVCTCPVATGDEISTVCSCEGPKDDDCDTYANFIAYLLLTAEKFFGVFMHMSELERKYNIESVAFWVVLGSILAWMGVLMLMYSEIKTVLIVRERDERDRLVNGNYLKCNESKMQEMCENEESMMLPRPYVTMIGATLFFLGVMAQLLPFCNVLSMVFPHLAFFHGICWLLVMVVALQIAASSVLLGVGLIWSCTRGSAALVLISLGLTGEVVVFCGILYIVLWLVLTVAVLYLYFKWAPEYFEETEGERREWLQDLGNWYRISPNPKDWAEAGRRQGELLGEEGLSVVKAFPGGATVADVIHPPPQTPLRPP